MASDSEDSEMGVVGGDCQTDRREGREEEAIEATERAYLVDFPGQQMKTLQFNKSSSRYEVKRSACLCVVIPQCVREKTTVMSLQLNFMDEIAQAKEELVSCSKHRLPRAGG